MKNISQGFRAWISIQLIITHSICIIFISRIYKELHYPQSMAYENVLLLFASTIILLLVNLQQLRKAYVLIGIFLSYIFYIIICYPVGNYLSIDILMVSNILAVALLRIKKPENYIIATIIILSTVMLQNPFSLFGDTVFGNPIPNIGVLQLVELALVLVIITYFYGIMIHNIKIAEENALEIERLHTNIYHLTTMNAIFQDKAILFKEESAIKERNRIVRDIHDITGYYFTNLLMLMKAALLSLTEGNNKSKILIDKAIAQTHHGIDEVRRTLRLLNSIHDAQVKDNITTLHELIQTFRHLTDIDVSINFGNLEKTYGKNADLTIYRFIQEGLTNAFRHGRATEIFIQFWQTERTLTINITDNGKGASKLTKGTGITGMEERMEKLNGTIKMGNLDDGFQISAFIPVPIIEKNNE
jgi:signal transduction histidine kinase